MTQKLVTKDSLNRMLNNPNTDYVDMVIGRALTALLQRQTEAEQRSNSTEQHNNVGFTGTDGRAGALTAKYFIKHKKLLQWQREMWLKPNKNGTARIVKYHKQLNEIAEEKKQCPNV